ncbi:MAG: hypothetical protein J5379_07940 [Clostridiales bacterium]|nr:hypothetical protein [Clostridiales bacterium]
MKVSNTMKRVLTMCLLLAVIVSACGCSKLPFFRKDSKTKEQYQQEATEAGYTVLKNILSADYESVKPFISSEERDEVEQVVKEMDRRLYSDAQIEIESVYTDEKTYDTNLQFRITLSFETYTTSVMCVMKLTRSGSSWRFKNALPFFSDMRRINDMYIDGKKQEEDARK